MIMCPSSWERFLEGCKTGLLWLCVHPLGKGFWKVVKQDYYDYVSSSIVLFLKCSLKRFWRSCETGLLWSSIIHLEKVFEKVVKQDYYDYVSSSWERFLEGCKTGLLWLCVHPRPIEDKQWNDINKLIYIIVLCTRAMGASDPGQNQANEKWVT